MDASTNGFWNKGNLTQEERVKFLKYKLERELRSSFNSDENANNQGQKPPQVVKHRAESPVVINDNIDYVDLSKVPITPINEDDERKKHDLFKLRQLATTQAHTTLWTRPVSKQPARQMKHITSPTAAPTTPRSTIYNPLSEENIHHQGKKHKSKLRAQHFLPIYVKPSSEKPVEIFYRSQRRLLYDDIDTFNQWTHCVDLVTPFLSGIKKDLSHIVKIGKDHRTVTRILQLISTNTTSYSKDDIYSMLYQISNLQLRLFQWDEKAITILLNVITRGGRHTFLNVKEGLMSLFKTWHMDFSNATNLLAQSRVFRPFCLPEKMHDGSTKSSKGTRHTMPTTPCDDSAE